MIKQLKSKIFFLIMISLSVLIVGIIVIFSVLNYSNTIKTATFMMDRFSNFEEKREKESENIKPEVEGLYFIEVKSCKQF